MIDHIVFDVDGTLTDGGITISDSGVESKTFQAKDGLLTRVLPKLGFTTMIITGRDSRLTNIRAEDLRISVLIQGVDDKATVLKQYFTKNRLTRERFAYIGDDLNDYAAMKLCGFKACPDDAAVEIRAICDYVSPRNGGHGAVRDICEHILKKEGKYSELLNFYGAS